MPEHTDRTGLYIMVLIILLHTCATNRRVKEIHKHLGSTPVVEMEANDGTS